MKDVVTAIGQTVAVPEGNYGTLSLLGDRMTWVTVHSALADAEPDSTGSCFFDVAEALHNHWHEKRDHNTVLAALNALRERNFGGIVAMIEALPAYPTRALQTLP